jgi:Phytanoyl-CoA dioxygenase (PhyH)
MSLDAKIHLDALTERGYTVIPTGVDLDTAGELLALIRRLNAERSRAPDSEQPFLNRGHDVLYNLQREGLAFTRVFTRNPLIIGILKGLLNDAYYKQIPRDQPNFLLRALGGRSSGKTTLPLHIDSFIPSSGQYCLACQVAIILEDQSPETGCTLIVPGSHRSDEYANQEAMSRAIPLTTKAGDIVIWDGRIWHGALGNPSGRSRWSLIATFARWWVKQNFDITGTLPQALYDAMDDDEKAILGYCSLPPRDENERTDMKAGHAQLKPHVVDYGGTGKPG